MDLREYLRVFRKSWALIVLCSILGVAGGALVFGLIPVKYTSTADLYVSVRTTSGDTANELLSGTYYASQVVTSYLDVVTSAAVLDQVINDNDLPFTKDELAEMVGVNSPEGTVLISIRVTDSDTARAATIANAVSAVFENVVENELEATNVDGESRVEIQLIDPAVPSVDRDGWGMPTFIALGLIVGFLVGLGVAFCVSLLDTRIHSVEDLKQITDAPMLGAIPSNQNDDERRLIMIGAPTSAGAEAIRKLRTNVEFLDADAAHRVFVVSSAVPGDGKSTVSANLAIAFAQAGLRVALVDADLRKPKLSEYLGIPGAVGLSDVLIGRASLEDSLQPWGRDQLFVLAAGIRPPNPSELLGSNRMKCLMEQLGEEYDFVIVDSPPLLLVTDASVVSRFASGIILVARSGTTRRPELESTINSIKASGQKLLGLVLSQIPTSGPDRYAYGHYRYGAPTSDVVASSDPVTSATSRRSTVPLGEKQSS